MNGTIKKLKNGRYQVRWREAGVQRAQNFRWAGQAQDHLRTLISKASAEPQASNQTFEAYARDWLDRYAKVEKSETTVRVDRQIIESHLLPAFGGRGLRELRRGDLEALKAKLVGTLNPNTINNVVSLAKFMVDVAVDWELIQGNPFAKVKRLKRRKQAFDFWTAEERDRFLAFCKPIDPEFHDLVLVAAHTGLRKGELRALERHQLDFNLRQIRVDANYSEPLRKRLPRTKNGEVEFQPMNQLVYRTLLDRKMAAAATPVFDPSLFSDCYGRFRRRAIKLGLRPLRFHDLRHTYVSVLVMAGVPIATVSKMARHKSLAMTMRYAHLAPNYLADAAEATCARYAHSSLSEFASHQQR